MAILCRGGKEMTILDVKTTDNQTYKVSTSVFAKDDYYTFSIEVAPGKIIDKTFSYKVNNPTVTNAVVTRTEGTRAEFDLYDVDEGGYIYVYIPGLTQVQSKARATEEITADLVKKGYKQDLKTGFNKVILKGLTEGIKYNVYYVLESYDGRTSDVHGPLTINGTVQEETNISKKYQIVSVSESTKNNITVKLNRAPEEELTLRNFSFICPSDSELTIDKATLKVSEDKLTYTIIIPENYGHKDNQYTAKITFSDGTIAKKTFIVNLTPPRITGEKVERISENKVKYTFTSDKAGVVYFGTYSWNGAANSENNTPKGQDILSGKVPTNQKVMNAGINEVEITYNGTDKDIFALHVDEYGNYAQYTAHDDIPSYVPPVEPEPALPIDIESVEATLTTSSMNPTRIVVNFTDSVDILDYEPSTGSGDAKFAVVSGGSLPSRMMLSSSYSNGNKTWTIDAGYKFTQGATYKIMIEVRKDNKYYTLEKEFIVK